MKYLVVVVVVVLALWLMLRGRQAPRARPKPPGGAPTDMVRCRHCGVHLPRDEAVEDSRGAFCNEAHRLAGPSNR
jgi:uncharacterized protein